MNNIIDMVKDKKVNFLFYKDGNLIYSTECGFQFPVPISDIGIATFFTQDRAMLFMRWIRKQKELIEKGETKSMEAGG